MSTIEKLSIQGIRSFGPNAEDCQSIHFSSPLTLILGENGCGKTTIIECLKYALTGDSPPGSDRGKSFVHDPKIFRLDEALGQIKVQVRDKRGARLSVCRSMKVFTRKGKTSFETLEATMNFMDDGKSKLDSISGRCVDVDTSMCEFMGVSKAIINNVLFCHQEDSSWPLDEAKKLKDKFDAIFGISEYNTAMEKIIKMRKGEMEALKVMEANLKLLVHLKQEMEDKTISLRKAEEKCDFIKDQCAKCNEEMKPIDARLIEIRNIEYEIGKYQAQKVEIETKYKNCREQIITLGRKIKNKFEGDLSELENKIRSFDQEMVDKKLERSELEEHVNKLKVEERGIQKTLVDFDKKRCLIQQQHLKEQECKKKSVEKIKSLCDILKIEIKNDFEDIYNSTEIIEDIQMVLMSKQSEIAELTLQYEVDDQKRQGEIDTFRVEVTKSEEGVATLQKQKNTYEKESNAIDLKIGAIEKSVHQLKALTKQIDDTDQIYEKTLKSFDQQACREIIETKKSSIVKLDEQFHIVDEKLTFLNSIAKQTAEINLKEKDLEKKELEVRRVRSKHSDNFPKIFNPLITTNYHRSLKVVYEKLRKEIKELNDKSQSLKLKEQSYEIKRKNMKVEIERKEKELEESKELVFQKSHATPFEDLLARSKATVSKYQLDHGALKSAEAMYKKYMQKINEDPCCPLCHKDMTTNEAMDLSSELSDEIQKLPDNILNTEKLLKLEQTKYENLLQLKPVIELIQRLEVDIPKMKDELKKIQVDLAETANECENFQMLIAEPTFKLDIANSMMGDMSLLDEAIKEAARVKDDLEKLKLKLPKEHTGDASIEQLQTEKRNITKTLEEERKSLNSNQQKYEKQMDALNRMREVKNKLKDQQIQLQEGVQSLPQLKERQDEITQLLIATVAEVNDLQGKIKPLKQKLETAIADKAENKNVNSLKLAKLQTKYNEFKACDHEIQRLNNEVLEFKKLNLEVELEKSQESIKIFKEKSKKMADEITKQDSKLEDIKTECLNQESIERELRDNKELKHLELKEMNLSEQCDALSKQLGNFDFRNVSKEKNELVQKKDKATVRKGELLGQIGEINNQIKKLQKEIEEPKYNDSIKNYRRANFEVLVTRRIVEDLGQHRVALEWSLIQFHSEKMEKINRLIREYWRLIYRGNDIDYIQIKTKADDEKNTEASADRKRSYNYRVVQSKNNSEIEMRGRCSAGQRVLASLIIRMALAETFSSNCGVLALDEPTTNLDRFNIMSLCDALNRIVEERQTQSNFMLIIITHDEEFISALGKINTYHRVFRNDECKSVIRKVQVF